MKEFANNLYDTIENITYDLERYNCELIDKIPNFMSFIHHDEYIRSLSNTNKNLNSIYNSIGFIIGNGESIFFDHALKVTIDILCIVERKHRILKNEVMRYENFVYSKDAYDHLIKFCNNNGIEKIEDCHDIDSTESIRTHYRKMLQKTRDTKFENYIEATADDMIAVLSKYNSLIYNTIYNLHLKIYYSSSKIATFSFLKEIISCLLMAANFISTIQIIQ